MPSTSPRRIAGPEDLTRRMVGRLAAQVLRGALRTGAIVGIGDGASVGAVADALEETATPVAATVVPAVRRLLDDRPGARAVSGGSPTRSAARPAA